MESHDKLIEVKITHELVLKMNEKPSNILFFTKNDEKSSNLGFKVTQKSPHAFGSHLEVS